DFTTSEGINENISPSVLIWGTRKYMLPSRIHIKQLWANNVSPSPTSPTPPTAHPEADAPFDSQDGEGWRIDLPPGGYHMELHFKIADWDHNPNNGKG
ncbi:MAG: hypothetical protein AAB683_01775, partial [Patescibacteria group bacterium]